METHIDPYLRQILINRYRLTELIGQGSMGKVYRAEDQLLEGVIVAVKFLAQSLISDQMRMRFANEARTGAQLGQRSIHIVRVLDYGVHQDEVPFYVMEYMKGHNLSDVIAVKPLSLKRFLNIARHMCLGLQCAHQGIKIDGQLSAIVHRDIKPSNVFVMPDPSLGELAKVLDFGIAKFFTEGKDGAQTRSFMGTLAYCSPEQIEGKDLDARSDIYSLGITMFETLTGQMPIVPEFNSIAGWYKAHHQQSPRKFAEVVPDLNLPPALESLVMDCMAKSPGNRPRDMNEILASLQDIMQPAGPPPEPDQVATAAPHATTVIEEEESPPTPASPPHPTSQKQFLLMEDISWKVSWPQEKPIAEIVFAQPLAADQPVLALWVMLSQNEIHQRLLSVRYNQFLCTMNPHPMILWITTLYDQGLGARWLPCYLDLGRPQGKQAALILSELGYYPLIFFASEDPEQPANVRTITISPGQCKLFQQWVAMAQTVHSQASANVSKNLLKAELEKLKPKILQKLNAAQPVRFA